MIILNEYPPLIDKIDEIFHTRGKEIIYAWGDKIYNPLGVHIPDFLIAHEEVHGKRQGDNIEDWWQRYMLDIEFRYQEELHAHAREFKIRSQGVKDRNEINRLLMFSANRLAAPLYGNLTSVSKASQDIKKIYYPQVR
jgi:hypothetical protein